MSVGGHGAVEPGLPDSIFTWVFQARDGSSWGGRLVADSAWAAAGDTMAGAAGTYTILVEDEAGVDLTPFGLEDGEVFVEWYWDASSGRFLPTRNGPSQPSGWQGLGSELDDAWSGLKWLSFGLGGTVLAAVDQLPADTRFDFVFEAASGDRWGGILFASAGFLATGATIATAFGAYRILGETPIGAGATAPVGTVRLTGTYFDQGSGLQMTIASADGVTVHGTSGLGSELAEAWNGRAWTAFGLGGSRQVDTPGKARFEFVFEANSGDRWWGALWGERSLYDPGSTVTTAHGRYVITAEAAVAANPAIPDGTVWIGGYFDALSGLTLTTFHLPRGNTSGSGGLGSELDAAWTGTGWAHFGLGGARQADVKLYSRFEFVFEANSGDRWWGALWDDRSLYDPGSTVTTAHGRYVITAEAAVAANPAIPDGTVWIGSYFDALSGLTLTTFHLPRGSASGSGGLGSELDAAWTGTGWAHFGLGGARQADVKLYSRFEFVFEANSGDRWWGALWDDRSLYDPGSTVATAHGRYVITAEAAVAANPAIPDGTVWIGSYFDALSGLTLTTFQLPRGSASGSGGLGSELDAAWTGTGWAHFGLGGARQADVKSFSVYNWRFEANSGDRWSGGLWEDRTRFEPGDVIATPHGRYVILSEVPREPIASIAEGTVWVTNYFDAQSGRTLDTWFWDRFGTFTTTTGLGSELDAAWTGTGWAHFGLGGLRQADALAGATDPWSA